MYSVCAVIVTYNRKELLLRNINSLLVQNYPLDILVYDNASTDGTEQYLLQNNIFEHSNFIYVKGEKNTGGAGGFRYGAEKACQRGYDYLWLMDDDGYCLNENTLLELIKCINDKEKMILNSYVTYDSNSLEPTFDIRGVINRRELLELSKNGIVKGGCPYNGTLIPCFCFEEVGYNDERFFIYGDENDFYYRTIKAGYEWLINMNSLYFHPVNRSIMKSFRFCGMYVEVKDQPIWKYYLEARNSEINAIRHFKRSKHRVIGYVRVMIVAFFSKDKKLKRMKYGFLGIRDAKKEFFERKLMFDK